MSVSPKSKHNVVCFHILTLVFDCLNLCPRCCNVRSHAYIIYSAGDAERRDVFVQDRSSTNGTKVDGVRVRAKT